MTLPNWKRNAQLYAALPRTDTTVGIYVTRDGDLAQVNVGDSTISVRSTTTYRPRPGDPVVLTWTNSRLRLTGPAQSRSSQGTVTAVANPRVTVTCDGRSYTLPYAVSLAGNLAVGDTVSIDWNGSYVKDKLSTAPDTTGVTPKLTTDQRPFTLTFFAKQSGSRKAGKWWTRDVRADAADVGGWFYGPVLRRSLKSDAYIASVEVYLPVRSTSGGLPRIGRHTQDTRPSGDLSVSDDATRGDRSGWVRLPVAWAEGWRDSAGGVAVNGGGSTVYRGIHADRQSGKLRIRGRQ